MRLTLQVFLVTLAMTYALEIPHYNLGVIILDNITPQRLLTKYIKLLKCALERQRDASVSLGVKITNVDKDKLSPKSVLQALCSLNTNISTIALILPNSNSYKYLPIYKYMVNHVSSLGIPLIIWNSYMPKGIVYNTVVHLGPQYDQQAEAYMTLLRYYKWYRFSILTTQCPGHIDFRSAIRRLVHDYVNDKGEQIMTILSSCVISNSMNRTTMIHEQLLNLRTSETRVILLHMTGDELKEVMRGADRLDMLDKEYMWMGTTQIYNKSTDQPQSLPLGMIALKYTQSPSDDEEADGPPLTKAMLTAANLWRDVVTTFAKTRNSAAEKPKLMSCSQPYRAEFWRDGQALYKEMIGYKAGETDIKGCGEIPSQQLLTARIAIDSKGMNRRTSLNFMNLAYTREKNIGSRKKIWKMIGSWHEPNITELDDVTWPGSSPKPPDGKPARSDLRVVTHEEHPYVKFTAPNSDTGACVTIGSVRVRLTNISEDNCPACTRNSSLFQCATGLCIDLLNKLQEDMQFNYVLMQARDNAWGNYIDKGTGKKEWNGLVRDLMDGQADISMTTLKIGPERSAVIEFSVPFIETGITIIVLIKKGVISATAFLGKSANI